jgi:hypothetical protein
VTADAIGSADRDMDGRLARRRAAVVARRTVGSNSEGAVVDSGASPSRRLVAGLAIGNACMNWRAGLTDG